jgi:hypothetical protein
MGASPVICCKEKVYYDYSVIDKVRCTVQGITSLKYSELCFHTVVMMLQREP